MPRQTLRQLLGNQLSEQDWARANSMEGGGNLADRQRVWDALVSQTGNQGYGSRGFFNLYSNPNPSGGGDNGGGGPSEGFGTSANQFFDPNAFGKGYSPGVWGTNNIILQDRGDYNYAAPDLGALEWDPEYGVVNNQEMIAGSRTNRSFDNFYNLTNSAIGLMAGAAAANGMGIQGIPGFDQVGGMPAGFGPNDLLPNMTFNPGPSINATGAFAGSGTGFNGFGSAGLLGSGSLGGPSELASVGESGGSLLGSGSPANVTVNQPGLFSNLPNWAQSGINNITSNPLNALRLGQGIAGIAGAIGNRGGGSQPATQSGKSGGTATQANVQRPEYTPNPFTSRQLQQLRRSGL